MLLKKLISPFLWVMEARRRKWSRNFLTALEPNPLYHKVKGERFARGRKGRSLFDKDVVEEVDQPVPEGDGGEEKEMVKELS